MDFTNNDYMEDSNGFRNGHACNSQEKRNIKKRRYQEVYENGSKDDDSLTKRPTPCIRLDSGFKWNLLALSRAAESVISGGKSPVCVLNELGVTVQYKVLDKSGPAHAPSFAVSVTVADLTFEGFGHSKREARASAARACLDTLLARTGHIIPPTEKTQILDFTHDEISNSVSEFQCLEAKIKRDPSQILLPLPLSKPQKPSPVEEPSPSPPEITHDCVSTKLFGEIIPGPPVKNPINLLYENFPGLKFDCTFGDGTPLDSSILPTQAGHSSMRFKVVCMINGQKFEGYGMYSSTCKKSAKSAAARSAIAVLEEAKCLSFTPNTSAIFLPQTLADHIGILVLEKFNEIMKGDTMHTKRKILAGVVITIDNSIQGAKVVALTTGTKCVSGEYMSVRGRSLNDCHAEVPARRCLQRYLYSQLLMYAACSDPKKPIVSSDLLPLPSGGYRLKPDRQVHVYVSSAPCGDGRIFSPHEHDSTDRHPNRLTRGQLRTKIESGEGTIPVKCSNSVIQTWDGVMQGERLLTMSCSDKMARWCVVGMQGALLSLFVKPIYMTSLVLGSLLHPHHMYRAICGRIEGTLAALPPPFSHTRPLLARAASSETRAPTRAPLFSVCWCCTSPAVPEVVNSTTGKLENGQPSMLCKQSMFARWQYLAKRLPMLTQENEYINQKEIIKSLPSLPYNEAKALAVNYQVAKKCLVEAFDKAKLGRWIKKPLEQDHFLCELLDANPTALFA